MDHSVIYLGSQTALASMQEAYAPELVPLMNDPELTEGVMSTPPATLGEEVEWIQGLTKALNKQRCLAVLAREGEEFRFIGTMGLHRIRWDIGSAESGSLLGPADRLAKGHGTEAKLLLLKYAFDVLNLRTVQSSVKAFNGRSLGHLLKCGYQVIGTVPDKHLYRGKHADEVLLYVTRKQWEPIWDTYKAEQTLPKLTDKQRQLVQGLVTKTNN